MARPEQSGDELQSIQMRDCRAVFTETGCATPSRPWHDVGDVFGHNQFIKSRLAKFHMCSTCCILSGPPEFNPLVICQESPREETDAKPNKLAKRGPRARVAGYGEHKSMYINPEGTTRKPLFKMSQ